MGQADTDDDDDKDDSDHSVHVHVVKKTKYQVLTLLPVRPHQCIV